MGSRNWIVLTAMMLGTCPLSEAGAQPSADGETITSASVMTINGKAVSADEVTSFGLQMEMVEGRPLSSQEELLEEYVLTHLYDKIPTTASLPADSVATSSAAVMLASQRNLLKRELQQDITENVEVPRDAMEKWYTSNISRYVQPERVHAYHLFLETSDQNVTSSPEKVRERLKTIKQEIDNGTSFSQAAKQYSEAASNESGGEIGKIKRAQPIGPLSKPMNIELENAFFSLEPQTVSDIIETRHGMHLLFVSEKETTHTPSLDDLITSRILPGVLSQDMATSAIRSAIADTVAKHNGKPAPAADNVTTASPAFLFDGKEHTFADLETIYGPRFSTFFTSVQDDPARLEELKQQALEDEAGVQAALDKGIAKRPEVQKQLEFMELREKARHRIEAVVNAESVVDEKQVLDRYNSLKDQLRQPEAEGQVILVSIANTSGTAEQARAIEYARRKAEEIRKRLDTEEFDKVVASLAPSDPDVVTSVTRVPRHVVGKTTDTMGSSFDQAVNRIQGEEGLSDVVSAGPEFIIAKLERRYPGEPMPLEAIKSRLESMVRGENEMQIKKDLVKRLEEMGAVKFHDGAEAFKSPDRPED